MTTGRRLRAICGILIVGASAAAAGMLPAAAAGASGSVTLYVQTGGTGTTCTTATSGACGSIQAAVTKAETYTGDTVTIVVGSGTYSGDITITASALASLTIEGQGGSHTVVQGGGPVIRVSSGTVAISDLEITGGTSVTAGGGVYNATAGHLTLSDDVITHDRAGLFGGGVANYGTLTLVGDTVSNDGSGDYGGGVLTAGPATFDHDTFSNDGTGAYGGGVYNIGAHIVLTHDVLSGDRAPTGGGGGIFVGGTATLTNDTLSGDSAGFTGGGAIEVYTTSSASSANLSGDTLAHDSSTTTGGAVMNFAHMTLTNDTFFTDSAAENGGAIYNGNTMNVVDSTVSNSRAQSGGAIYNYYTLSVDSSIVDSGTCGGRSMSGSHNVVASATCAGVSTDVLTTSARIGLSTTLAANTSTGPTTLAIGPGSAAVDVVPSSACTVTVDERGDHRPGVTGQTNCDAGAFELQGIGQAPSIASADHAIFAVGEAGTFQVLMAPGVFPTPTYSLTGAPAWLSVTAASGTIAATPATGTVGTYSFTIKATNGITPPASQPFTLTVDQPPTITSADHATFTTGKAGTFQVTVTAHTFPTPPTYTETGALPKTVIFSSSGLLSGTPGAGTGGTYSFTIKATNGITFPASQPFTLTVDQPPTITSAHHATFTVGVPGSFGVTVTGYPAPTVTESGTLPDGVHWTAPAHTLSGTPALGTAGTYALSFTATNGVSPAATQVFTLVVPTVPPADRTAQLPGAPALTTATPGTGDVKLVWTAPKTAGSAAVTGYEVCDTTTAAALTRCPTATTAGTATSLTLTGLTDGTTYDFEVRAKDASGYGPFSNEKIATPGAPAPLSATRVFGQTPDATAAAELARAFPFTKGVCPASRAAVVATTTTYQDGLSSQYLAQSLTTGTLLTPTKSLSPVTASALKDEGITTVYLVGGPLALTTTVLKSIEALTAYECGGKTKGATTGKVAVHRLYGQTQYGTAAAIAEHVGTGASLSFPGAYGTTNATGGTGKYNDTKGSGSFAPTGPVPTAILANGTEFQDAQAASVVSYHTKLPLLLTPATTLSPTALGAIGELGIKQVILMGGTLAVTNTVENALAKAGVSVLRVAGKDYTDTTLQLARFEAAGSTAGLGWTPGHEVLVARGNGFTDGIAGALLDGPHNTATGAAGTVRPLLLTESPTAAGASITTFLKVTGRTGIGKTAAKTITSLTILGGPLAVSTAVVTQMQTALAH